MVFGLRNRRRDKLRSNPPPADWARLLTSHVPVFHRLSPADQRELLGHMQVMIDEKHFEGCGGLEMTEEIRVTIAALACLLLLHRDTDYYPNLISILVYPSGYTAEDERYIGGGLWEEGPEDRLGHTAHNLRALVLAWDAVRHGAIDPSDGHNVVLHEFAHQLDFENRSSDGTPALDTHSEYESWGRVMGAEFEALRQGQPHGVVTVLDYYGAQNPTEFFAVATEAFFERPLALRERHPDLYEIMKGFFRQDPVTYSAEEFAP
ncbi:MAG: M90 family metallopeptidase [Gemmatimonadaceae bacterium]